MKRWVLAVFVAGVVMAAGPAAAVDFSGIWAGSTQVPNVGDDPIRLELKAEGGSYAGVMSDGAGMIMPNPITNVKVDGATIAFDIAVNGGQGAMPVRVTLKLDGDTLAGGWATEDGMSGALSLARQK
jgi:hypothetical protein